VWFWPGETWDHNIVVYQPNRDLPDFFGITSPLGKAAIGLAALGIFGAIASGAIHFWITSNEFSRKVYKRMSLVQYATLQFFLISMLLLPLKIVLRLTITLKYILVTPWLNI
jgi:hypothetical protein